MNQEGMNQILTDEEVSAITGIGFEVTGRAIEQAILNKLSERDHFRKPAGNDPARMERRGSQSHGATSSPCDTPPR